MSLPIPLTVRLSTSRADRHVTRDVRDLVMRWTDPGGYASCQITLDRPLSLQPDEIAYYGNLTVYDARHGGVVWDGRQEDPGRSAGSNGQVWDLTAVGGQAHTRDRTVPLIYVDQELSAFVRALQDISPGATADVRPDAAGSGADSLHLHLPAGLPVTSGARAAMRYDRIWRSGQKIARVDYTWDSGLTNTSYVVRAVLRLNGSPSVWTISRTQTTTTAGSGSSPIVVVTHWPDGRNTLDLELAYLGADATVGNGTAWASIMNMRILAMRYSAAGIEQTTGYTSNTVLASEVVADLLGRLLTQFDGANASIATTTHGIDQLAYPDGADPNKVLADLLALESGHTWRVWERTTTGKYRFEFVPVPTSVRYEADATDGYDSQGSADGLYNQVTVRWQDATGQTQTTTRTATVAALDDAGLIRQGRIDLGSEVGSLANAQRAGDQWLADRAYAANAGRLRIARPILDRDTGRMVMPWEIRPGLIRVRGIMPRVDAINGTARDGVTVFRIVASEFRASDGAATLELDSYAPSVARSLAELRAQSVYRRR